MLVTLTIEEINTFPESVRDFLLKYSLSKLALIDSDNVNNSKKTSNVGRPLNIEPNWAQEGVEWTEGYTRHGRRLIADVFEWERMLSVELNSMRGESQNDLDIYVNGSELTVDWENSGDNIEFDDPRTWGFFIIFCALFGFGGNIEGYKPARNPKELCKNLEKLGISGGKPIEARSIGPLLKSITKFVIAWHPKFLVGPPHEDIHWFDFDKTGNFYFAGNTYDQCLEAAKVLSLEYLIKNHSGNIN